MSHQPPPPPPPPGVLPGHRPSIVRAPLPLPLSTLPPPPPPPPLLNSPRTPASSPLTGQQKKAQKTKDGLIRMLLQSATPTPMMPSHAGDGGGGGGGLSSPFFASLPNSPLPSPMATPPSKPGPPRFPIPSSGMMGGNSPIRIMPPTAVSRPSPLLDVVEEEKSSSYIHQISGCEREIGLVMLDHPYAKPWNWKPDSVSHLRPTKTLFVPRVSRNQLPLASQGVSEVIDIMEEEVKKSRPLDLEKAELVMNECLRHANFANPNVKPLSESEDSWEENMSKDGWTVPLHRLFNKTMKILHADRLARLAQEGVINEPIFRRLMVDKASKRMRQVLAGVVWDTKMTQWLHSTLCDNLPLEYLASYFDVLQSLRASIPSLIDKMTLGRVCHQRYAKVTREGLRILLKKKWDPATSSLNEQKMKKLPGSPILILTPSGPSDVWHNGTSRARHWNTMLSQLGKLVPVTMPPVEKDGTTEIGQFLQQTVTAIISRIREVKRGNHDRPVILIGWGAGAAINCQVAAMESVHGIVCLGFPIYTLDGIRGEADDPLLDLKCPILFVVGQNACQTRPDDIEDMRERMRRESGLVIVGGADDLLRVSKHKKKAEGVTQSMVDRCIMDDVREFLVTTLTSPPLPTFAMPIFSGAIPIETPPSSRKTPVVRKRKPPATNPDGSPVVKRAKNQTKSNSVGNTPIKNPHGMAAIPTTLASSAPVPAGNLSALSASLTSTLAPNAISASFTPTTALPKLAGSDGLQKARKVLDMSQKGKADIMASSPLLSSALTSPTKPATAPPPRLVPSSASLPTSSIVLPTRPTAPPLRHPTVIHPPMPSLASMMLQQHPHPLPAPTIVMPSPKLRPQFASPSPTVVRMVSATAPMRQMSNVIPPDHPKVNYHGPNPPSTSLMVLTTQSKTLPSRTVVHTVPSSAASSSRFTVSPGTQSISVRKTVPGGQVTKDNLYIVSMPHDQLKSLEGKSLIPYSSSQMLTLLTDQSKGTPVAGMEGGAIGSTERHNVAEILASLSGLVPEPPKKADGDDAAAVTAKAVVVKAPSTVIASTAMTKVTLSRPSASILSTASGGTSRVVRVLQAGATRMPIASQQLQQSATVKLTPLTMSPGGSSGMRSRKQIFVTAADRVMEEEGANEEGGASDRNEKAQFAMPVLASKSHGQGVSNDDQDILEEDVGDMEYTPYPRKKPSPKQKTKCKGVKK